MKSPAGKREMAERVLMLLLLLSAVLAAAPLPQAAAQDAASRNASSDLGQRMILNVFLDSSGKALLTGYAEDAAGLDFLNGSDFRLDSNTSQLYALTDRLTEKSGDIWTLNFSAEGGFGDYRVTFYLPRDTSLGEIDASPGLSYLLSASNESIVADVQGYDVTDPRIVIHYRQTVAGGMPPAPPPGSQPMPPLLPQGMGLILTVIAAALLVAGFAAGVILRRHGGRPGEAIGERLQHQSADAGATWQAKTAVEAEISEEPDTSGGEGIMAAPGPMPSEQAGTAQSSSSSDADDGDEEISPEKEAQLIEMEAGQDASGNRIAISSEMEAVMQTLTPRERAVMATLIEYGGRMTQAEIRYETGTPKSSLTGILISLERRKLITKKEWGRTNIIELSEWFLSKKERF